jgi:hypothetical protein
VLARHFGKQVLETLALAAVAEAWGLRLTIVDGIRDHHEAHEDIRP